MKSKSTSDNIKQNKVSTQPDETTKKPYTPEQDKLAKDVLKTKDF